MTTAIANGDLSRCVDVRGEILELKNTIYNTMVDRLNGFAGEVSRVAREVGTEGNWAARPLCPAWPEHGKDLTDNVNWMASNLTGQVRTTSPTWRPLWLKETYIEKITVDVKGEILELKNTLDAMVDQLNAFASKSRVARSAPKESSDQAQVRTSLARKDLTDNVDFHGE